MVTFAERLQAACEANSSLLCVGLDPDPALMPIADVADFNRAIVEATKDLVCAYKPNLAFYEAMGLRGMTALRDTLSFIRAEAPDLVIIGDAKRGDMGSTNAHYARALFEVWGFDAATVNAFAGGDALAPFLEYESQGVFVWCRSSNPGSSEFQDLKLGENGTAKPLYEWIATRAGDWNRQSNVGLVVGATYPKELDTVRRLCPELPILMPGIGAQGGDLPASVKVGVDCSGRGLLASASRSVLYASRDRAGFAMAARQAAGNLRSLINRTLEAEGKGW